MIFGSMEPVAAGGRGKGDMRPGGIMEGRNLEGRKY